MPTTTFRETLAPADPDAIRRLVRATGFFRDDEVAVAGELAEERLAKGDASGYHFVIAEENGAVLGYACVGPIPCTVHSWDLYWVAVAPERQGRGLGAELARRGEAVARAAGGRRMYADTSTRPDYLPTRRFYERNGYTLAASLPDFYDTGDGKAIYCKVLKEQP